jgi:hypothetical protein
MRSRSAATSATPLTRPVGRRTSTAILLIGLGIIIAPTWPLTWSPNSSVGQRLAVRITMGHSVRPPGSNRPGGTGGGPGRVLSGGRDALGIPRMSTRAMICVIVGNFSTSPALAPEA